MFSECDASRTAQARPLDPHAEESFELLSNESFHGARGMGTKRLPIVFDTDQTALLSYRFASTSLNLGK
jgi:hypothetical protein